MWMQRVSLLPSPVPLGTCAALEESTFDVWIHRPVEERGASVMPQQSASLECWKVCKPTLCESIGTLLTGVI